MKRGFCLATFTSLALTLTACGGATVESEDVTATESTPASAASTSVSEVAATQTSTSNGSDGPVQEVDTVPPQSVAFSPEEQAFLDHLRENGVHVDGVEDQLTATGFTVCSDDLITRDAVAGQLVEQRRTDMDAGAVATLISDSARANLCG